MSEASGGGAQPSVPLPPLPPLPRTQATATCARTSDGEACRAEAAIARASRPIPDRLPSPCMRRACWTVSPPRDDGTWESSTTNTIRQEHVLIQFPPPLDDSTVKQGLDGGEARTSWHIPPCLPVADAKRARPRPISVGARPAASNLSTGTHARPRVHPNVTTLLQALCSRPFSATPPLRCFVFRRSLLSFPLSIAATTPPSFPSCRFLPIDLSIPL